MTEFSARWLCWFGLGWAVMRCCLGLAEQQMAPVPALGGGGGNSCCPGLGSLHPSDTWVCHDRGLGLVPRLSLPLFLSVLYESLSCQNGWLRLLRTRYSNSCSGSISNRDEQVLVLTEEGLAAVIVCLFGSIEGEAKENSAVSPVLSFILHPSTPHIWGCTVCIFVIWNPRKSSTLLAEVYILAVTLF